MSRVNFYLNKSGKTDTESYEMKNKLKTGYFSVKTIIICDNSLYEDMRQNRKKTLRQSGKIWKKFRKNPEKPEK